MFCTNWLHTKCYFIICVRCMFCNDTYAGKVYPLRASLLKTQITVKIRYMVSAALWDYHISCRHISPVRLGVNYTTLICMLLSPRDVFYIVMVYTQHYRSYGTACATHIVYLCKIAVTQRTHSGCNLPRIFSSCT